MLEIVHAEAVRGTLVGVIVQFGGQTPLKLAEPLERAGVPILGTTPDAIDLAEDRDRFARLLHQPQAPPTAQRHRQIGRRGAPASSPRSAIPS